MIYAAGAIVGLPVFAYVVAQFWTFGKLLAQRRFREWEKRQDKRK